MVVKIRFARFGPRHSPFYNIVVAQARYVFFTFDDPDYLTTFRGPHHWAMECNLEKNDHI